MTVIYYEYEELQPGKWYELTDLSDDLISEIHARGHYSMMLRDPVTGIQDAERRMISVWTGSDDPHQVLPEKPASTKPKPLRAAPKPRKRKTAKIETEAMEEEEEIEPTVDVEAIVRRHIGLALRELFAPVEGKRADFALCTWIGDLVLEFKRQLMLFGEKLGVDDSEELERVTREVLAELEAEEAQRDEQLAREIERAYRERFSTF